MRFRSIVVPLAAFALALLVAGSAGAAMIGIYRNGMDTTAQRAQLVKLSGRNCARGGSETALRVVVGKRTSECSYRTPVLGRDLEIAATQRLLSGTPKAVRNQAFLSLQLRAGGGAKYQLLVFPLQRKVQLIRDLAGELKYLAVGRNEKAVMGINEANALRLRAVNITSGPEKGKCQLFAYVGGTLVAEAVDDAAGDLAGRASAASAGATKSAKGVIASIDDVVVRVPSPFG
jgi:hypothetical protein